jgi:hypothetical protein
MLPATRHEGGDSMRTMLRNGYLTNKTYALDGGLMPA